MCPATCGRLALLLALGGGVASDVHAQSAGRAPLRGMASIILKLADSTQLQVTDSTPERSVAGTASIPELLFNAPLAAGVDTLRELPEGTWSVHIRALGFEPRAVALRARPASSYGAPVVVRMVPLVRTLDAVNIVARHDQKVLDGIDARMRVAHGTLIKADNPFLVGATVASDALRAGRGFQWKSPTDVVAGRCKSAKGNLLPLPPPRATLPVELAVYLDGVRVRGGLETLNNSVQPDDILAIETYPDVPSAPLLWQTPDACAVVSFWTRHAQPGSD